MGDRPGRVRRRFGPPPGQRAEVGKRPRMRRVGSHGGLCGIQRRKRLAAPAERKKHRHSQRKRLVRRGCQRLPSVNRGHARRMLARHEFALRQHRAVTNVVRQLLGERAQQRHGLLRARGGHARNGQVEVALAAHQFEQPLLVRAGVRHVAKIDELPQRIGRLERVLAHLGRMQACIAGLGVPAGHRLHGQRHRERLADDAAVHVLAHRKPQRGKRGGRDVEQGGRADPFAGAETRPGEHGHAELTVPPALERRALLLGDVQDHRPIGAGVEAVVGDQHHRDSVTAHGEQLAKQAVMRPVHAVHHVAVDAQVRRLHVRHARRAVLHEVVADGVDGVVEHHGAIPRVAAQRLERGAVKRSHPGEFLGERGGTGIAARGLRHVRKQLAQRIATDVSGTYARRRNARRAFRAALARRVHQAIHHRPRRARCLGHLLHQQVAHARAVDGLRRVRCVPAHHVHAQPALREHVPERLRPARGARRDTHALPGRVRFHEVQDAVLVGGLPGGNGGPQDRRELRFQRAQVGAGADRHQARQVRHLPARQQRVDHLPVGGVPTEDQEALRRCGHEAIILRKAWEACSHPAIKRTGAVQLDCPCGSVKKCVEPFSDDDACRRGQRRRAARARPELG